MKKLLIALSITLFTTGISMAYMSESEVSDIDTLRSQGYSESALQIMDTVKANNQGINGKYVRRFHPKQKSPYTTLKLYVDPIQDDGEFGMHQIMFSNTWMGDNVPYASLSEQNANFSRQNGTPVIRAREKEQPMQRRNNRNSREIENL